MSAEEPAVGDRPTDTRPPERRRRPELARTAPLRHAATLLRETAPAEAAPARPGAAADAAPAEGPVALGVRLGYQVIEEQILQGQKLAQRLGRAAGKAAASAAGLRGGAAGAAASGAHAEAAAGAGEFNALIDRVLHLYQDFGALCVDAVESLARNPALRSGVARMTPGRAPGPGEAGAGGSGFAVDITCSRRTVVALDLRQRPGGFTPRVHALHAADPGVPPLTGVLFSADPRLPEPVLQLVIADTQPAATYTGVVVDSASNEPRGTLSVRLMP